MISKIFYLTTPIFYANDKLHIGHIYTMIMADVIVRYKKSKMFDVYFQTGSDDHGTKIEKRSLELNLSPQKLTDKNSFLFQELWKKIGIDDYIFYRTSSVEHKKRVQKTFSQLLEQDDIYLGTYQGEYCIVCEEFVSEKKTIKKNKCSFCFNDLQVLQEPAFFLRVSKYKEWLKEFLLQNPHFISPASAQEYIFKSFLENDVRDLCVTRLGKWGVEVPGSSNLVVYVWLDALLNYNSSSLGEIAFSNKNKKTEIVHLIGKDIVRFHGLYWPIILKASGLRLPNKIISHGWIMNQGRKMSKSGNNAIDPEIFLERYPIDLIRTYLVAKVPFLQDGNISFELLDNFYQDFLLHNLGNLVSRIHKMIFLYNAGIVPDCGNLTKDERLNSYFLTCRDNLINYQLKMDNYELTSAFDHIVSLINKTNKFINDCSPWNNIRDYVFLNNFLNYAANGVKIISFLLKFVIPEKSKFILSIFSFDELEITWDNCLNFSLVKGKVLNELKKHIYEPLNKK